MINIKILIILCFIFLQIAFTQSMKIHSTSGVDEYSLSQIDSITFTVIPDTVDLTRGLVAYYPFNGNANDESGNGNNGTIYGPVLADDRAGNPNSAYFFDGIDDYMDIGNDTSIKPQLPVSFSYWIHYVVFGYPMGIFTNNYVDDYYYGIWSRISTENKININFGDGGGGTGRRTKTSNTITSPGVWYHVVGIIRGPQNMDIYINGAFDGGVYSGSGGSLTYDSNSGNIGRQDASGPGIGPEYFNGRIDELRIYNRELNPSEVQALYNQ
jgi:concanavalin A-like lectin/glucanase superfamily protein